MRVIGGRVRGRSLLTLDLPHLRPMLDRVRENLFNIVRFDIQGASVLDLFSGCGSLGIEALSQGAASCVFVESDTRLVDCIEENLGRCELLEMAYVLKDDVYMLPGRPPPPGHEAAEVVFADPPYEHVNDPNQRSELFDVLEGMVGHMIVEDALLMLHHAPMPHALWPTDTFHCFDKRVYGNSQLSFFEVEEREE